MSKELCESLREIVELIASLYVVKSSSDHFVNARIRDMLDKLDELINIVEKHCGKDCYDELRKLIDMKMFNEDGVDSALMKIHVCMVNYGCRSNVSIVG